MDIEVEGGSVPTVVQGPRDAGGVPAVVVVPSVFGPAPDLLERLGELGDSALVCVPDPFWRTGEGALAYGDMDAVVARFGTFDVAALPGRDGRGGGLGPGEGQRAGDRRRHLLRRALRAAHGRRRRARRRRHVARLADGAGPRPSRLDHLPGPPPPRRRRRHHAARGRRGPARRVRRAPRRADRRARRRRPRLQPRRPHLGSPTSSSWRSGPWWSSSSGPARRISRPWPRPGPRRSRPWWPSRSGRSRRSWPRRAARPWWTRPPARPRRRGGRARAASA